MSDSDRDGLRPPSGIPARGYTRPPFAPGHELSLKHGAFSPRKVQPLTTALIDALQEAIAAPDSSIGYLADPSYRLALWHYAETEARRRLVAEWLLEQGGEIDAAGEVRAASALLDRLDKRAESLRSKLGLDPMSRARMGRDIASAGFDLARFWADQGEGEDHVGDDHQGGDAGDRDHQGHQGGETPNAPGETTDA